MSYAVYNGHLCITLKLETIPLPDNDIVLPDMSLIMRKPVFGVSDQVPHKPYCTVTEDG